jgi:predicted acetyltransferase
MVNEYFESVVEQEWFVVVDDLIGGFAISTVDKPLSEIDFADRSVFVVAEVLSKELGDYIVYLHEQRRLA